MRKQSNNYKDHIACHTFLSVVVLSLQYRLSDLEGGALVFSNIFAFKDQQVAAIAGCLFPLALIYKCLSHNLYIEIYYL